MQVLFSPALFLSRLVNMYNLMPRVTSLVHPCHFTGSVIMRAVGSHQLLRDVDACQTREKDTTSKCQYSVQLDT
jgi:hypothetical protein